MAGAGAKPEWNAGNLPVPGAEGEAERGEREERMKPGHKVMLYFLMISFDVFVLAGSAYLVEWRGWSAWWFVLALLMTGESSPWKLMERLKT